MSRNGKYLAVFICNYNNYDQYDKVYTYTIKSDNYGKAIIDLKSEFEVKKVNIILNSMSISNDGNTLVLGINMSSQSSVYVYTYSESDKNWILLEKVLSNIINKVNQVALSSNNIVTVSVYNNQKNVSVYYVYRYDITDKSLHQVGNYIKKNNSNQVESVTISGDGGILSFGSFENNKFLIYTYFLDQSNDWIKIADLSIESTESSHFQLRLSDDGTNLAVMEVKSEEKAGNVKIYSNCIRKLILKYRMKK